MVSDRPPDDSAAMGVYDRRGLPSLGTDPNQSESAHRRRDGFAGDDLPLVTQVGEDSWGTINLVGVVVVVEANNFCSIDSLHTARSEGPRPRQAYYPDRETAGRRSIRTMLKLVFSAAI